jgi:IS605 OrfB family transposase
MLSKKVKLNLDYYQKIVLETLSNEHRLLYNHLLEKAKTKLDFKELNNFYKEFRDSNNLTINSKSSQNTCISLINNIKSYLILKKTDKTARFPYKFKSYKYFCSFTLDYNKGCGGFKLNNNFLELNLNSCKNKLLINLTDYIKDISNENIKIITFSKENNDYFISLVYQEESKKIILNKDSYLSLDLGYSKLFTGTSNKGNIILNNLKQIKLQENIEHLQSKKDRLTKDSKRFKKVNKVFKRLKRRLVNKQKDFFHKSSKKVIDYCINNQIGKLIIGDIKVKSIIKSSNNKINGLSKSTGISRFKTFLEYKSKNADIETILVNEAYTSQINCLTGLKEFNSDLKNRKFLYKNIEIDRDLNSAINILTKSGKCLTQDQKIGLLLNKISELKVY